MKFLYLDKKDRVVAWLTPVRSAAVAGGILIVLAIPVWHDSVSGHFVLEPEKVAVVRAIVPGTVAEVNVKEGQNVEPGTPLAKLVNLSLASAYDQAQARLVLAKHRATMASLNYADYGTALKEREQYVVALQQMAEEQATLDVVSPISGTVMTPRVGELLGNTLKTGDGIVEVADLSALRARIYVLEWDMNRVKAGADARIQVNGFVKSWEAQITRIASEPTEMQQGLGGDNSLGGVARLHYYLVDLTVRNPGGALRPGMTGLGRIYAARRSLAGMAWDGVRNFWGRKFW